MSNTEIQQQVMQESTNHHYTKEEYNRLPVYYCKSCGSLKIMTMPGLSEDYCDSCGSTNIGKASIEAWLELQKTVFKSPYPERPKKQINIFR